MSIKFPEGMERDFARKSIKPGKILYLSIQFPDQEKPKDKYMIVVGFDKWPLMLKINSKISSFVKKSKNRKKCQLSIKAGIYGLNQNSYIDCSYIWYLLPFEEVENQIYQDRNRVIGNITDDHAKEIIKLVRHSKTISPLHKDIVSESLKN